MGGERWGLAFAVAPLYCQLRLVHARAGVVVRVAEGVATSYLRNPPIPSTPGRWVLGLEISVCAGAFHEGMMPSPDEVVTRFCELWSKPDLDEIASCFTEDAVYRNIPPTPSVEGREAIREFIAEFLATLDGIDFIVHRQISDHGVVMHERTDVLRRKDGVEISVPIMGVFEIADGKIATWRDYFDTAITSAFSS
jgi:limonene-1,2-epoxide hydrolase